MITSLCQVIKTNEMRRFITGVVRISQCMRVKKSEKLFGSYAFIHNHHLKAKCVEKKFYNR